MSKAFSRLEKIANAIEDINFITNNTKLINENNNKN